LQLRKLQREFSTTIKTLAGDKDSNARKLLLDGRLVAHIADSTVSTQHWLQLSRVNLNTFCTGTQAMTAESVVTADDSECFLEMVHAHLWPDLGSAHPWVALRHLNTDVEWFIDFWQLTATRAPLPCMEVGQGHQAQRLAPRTQLWFLPAPGAPHAAPVLAGPGPGDGAAAPIAAPMVEVEDAEICGAPPGDEAPPAELPEAHDAASHMDMVRALFQ